MIHVRQIGMIQLFSCENVWYLYVCLFGNLAEVLVIT